MATLALSVKEEITHRMLKETLHPFFTLALHPRDANSVLLGHLLVSKPALLALECTRLSAPDD
jgi:hypothetical protein